MNAAERVERLEPVDEKAGWKACYQCYMGRHSRCLGDYGDHCGCDECYGDDTLGPFYVPVDREVGDR